MRKLARTIVLLGLLLLPLGSASAASESPPTGRLAANAPTLPRHVLSSGGGSISQGDIVLHSVIGQPVAGHTVAGTTDLCTGYLCFSGSHKVFLPLLLKY